MVAYARPRDASRENVSRWNTISQRNTTAAGDSPGFCGAMERPLVLLVRVKTRDTFFENEEPAVFTAKSNREKQVVVPLFFYNSAETKTGEWIDLLSDKPF